MDRLQLFDLGKARVQAFCRANQADMPEVVCSSADEWHVNACAYYRWRSPGPRICICLESCAVPCGQALSRQWSWPGSTIDRTPYGVLAHELGHHFDVMGTAHEQRGSYSGLVCQELMEESGEKPLTSYAPNPSEWFAEMFRLFVTNHDLLKVVRPATWRLFRKRWKPVSGGDWVKELGPSVPPRVVAAQRNKICA